MDQFIPVDISVCQGRQDPVDGDLALRWPDKVLPWQEAKSWQADSEPSVVLLGFVTAVGGGVVRDMMVNDIPFILHEDFYGTVSILVAAGLFILDQGAWVNVVSLHLLFAGGLAIRLLAHWQELALPKLGRQSDADA